MTLSKSRIEYLKRGYNWYKGCYSGCTYCYALGAALRFNTVSNKEAWLRPSRRVGWENPVAKLETYLKNHTFPGPLMLCTGHDPAFDDTVAEETAAIISVLNKAGEDDKVLVLTKFPTRMLAALGTQSFAGFFGASITGLNDKEGLRWEPGAELLSVRLTALRNASARYKTWVSAEPILPNQNIIPLLDALSFVDWVVWGKMNVRGSTIPDELKKWANSPHWKDEVNAAQHWASHKGRITSIAPILNGFWTKKETKKLTQDAP